MKNLSNLYVDYLTNDNINYIIGVSKNGLSYFLKAEEFDEYDKYHIIEDVQKVSKYKEELVKYFNKELNSFNLILDLVGTEFQKSVWEVLLRVPYGTTKSYSDIAIELGDVKKVRAVANAIGKNNILIVVPCHRILGKDKSLTGFSSGLYLKEYLLNLEDINDYLL